MYWTILCDALLWATSSWICCFTISCLGNTLQMCCGKAVQYLICFCLCQGLQASNKALQSCRLSVHM